jgi:hypothetical protein
MENSKKNKKFKNAEFFSGEFFLGREFNKKKTIFVF